jgi:hypothetical protein
MALGTDPLNAFTNPNAKKALGAPIFILFLWLLARLFSGMFDFLRGRRAVAAPAAGAGVGPGAAGAGVGPVGAGVGAGGVGGAPGAVAPVMGRGRFGEMTHELSRSLRDLFIWISFAWLVNYLVNGFTHGLMALLWVTAVFGVIWALFRKLFGVFSKFADFLLLPLAAMILALVLIPLDEGYFGKPLHL